MDKNVIDHVFLGKWRMNRRQYLYIIILIWFLNLSLTTVSWIILSWIGYEFAWGALIWMTPILTTLYTLFTASVIIRRGHDISIPTIVWVLVVILNWISSMMSLILTVLVIQDFPLSINKILFLLHAVSLLYSLSLIFIPGIKKTNKYWEQPKDLRKVSEIIRFWWTGKS